jgi:hypothetical protein
VSGEAVDLGGRFAFRTDGGFDSVDGRGAFCFIRPSDAPTVSGDAVDLGGRFAFSTDGFESVDGRGAFRFIRPSDTPVVDDTE